MIVIRRCILCCAARRFAAPLVAQALASSRAAEVTRLDAMCEALSDAQAGILAEQNTRVNELQSKLTAAQAQQRNLENVRSL